MGQDIVLPQEVPLEDRIIGKEYDRDVANQHEMARLVMADLEDIFYSAVCRAISDTFGGEK
ncbi:MAG: hypothetical protein ACRC0X_09390 [Brevinema sp.]